MSLVQFKQLKDNTMLGVWHIEESKQELIKMLNENLVDVSQNSSNKETLGIHWLASRVLIQSLFGPQRIHIHKNIYNKPVLDVDGKHYFIGITHSNKYAGVIISEKHEVGIDIEKIDIRIERVAHKFLNISESHFINQTENNILGKTLIWSAKETIYKVYGKKEVDFKNHITIKPFMAQDSGTFNAALTISKVKWNLKIDYEVFDSNVLTYCIHWH